MLYVAIFAWLSLEILRIGLIAAWPDLKDATWVSDGVCSRIVAGGVLSSLAICGCACCAIAWLGVFALRLWLLVWHLDRLWNDFSNATGSELPLQELLFLKIVLKFVLEVALLVWCTLTNSNARVLAAQASSIASPTCFGLLGCLLV